jgi:predicted acylesterase/phospholipase RssA
MEPIKVQLVFQGGGARVFGHFAACEILEEMASKRQILITAVAGSSAGALAAAALGMENMPVQTIKQKFLEQARSIEKNFSRGKFHTIRSFFRALRVLRGGSFYSNIDLLKVFENTYKNQDSKRPYIKVGELKYATFIYYSDTRLGRMVPAPESEEIASALAKSCNFPFAFSGWKERGEFVDGGLGYNLPVDDLYAKQDTKGEVIAFCFDEEIPSDTGLPFITYIQKLFSTSINASVQRSKELIGENNTITISTDIKTFDFINAIRACEGKEFGQVKDSIRRQLENWIERRRNRPESLVKPCNANLNLPKAFTSHLQFEAQSAPLLHARKVVSADVAILNYNGENHDRYRTTLCCDAEVMRPTQLIRWRQSFSGNYTAGDIQVRGSVQNPNGTNRRFEIVLNREYSLSKNSTVFDIYFCFDSRLNRGDRAVFQYELDVPNPFPLAAIGQEFCTIRAVHGPIDEAFILVGFPNIIFQHNPLVIDICDASIELKSEANLPLDRCYVSTTQVDAQPLLSYAGVNNAAPFFLVSRKAESVPYLSALGFIIDAKG